MNQLLESEHELIPYRLYVLVWLALITLTCVTVGVSYLDMRNIPILTAVLIALVKATLVGLYFMHLRYDDKLVIYMVAAGTGVYITYFVLTFSDYLYR